MIFSKAVLAAAAMMASSTVFARRCGTPGMTPDQVTNFNTLATKAMTKLTAVKANFQKAELQDVEEKVIKVYVHVLANGTKVEDGYLDVSFFYHHTYNPPVFSPRGTNETFHCQIGIPNPRTNLGPQRRLQLRQTFLQPAKRFLHHRQ